jgi:acetyl-CoA carboxylase biotin carboxyl carrier protein
MSTEKLGLDDIKDLVEWMQGNQDVQEFSLKYGELELFMSRSQGGSPAPAGTPQGVPAAPPPAPAAAAAPQAAPAAPASTPAAQVVPKENEVVIKAPMVGTFYAAPKPGAPPFVTEGQPVTAESVLCIVEVMKLMTSIQAHVDGVVEKILVTNGEAVEYGQPLMLIRKQ